MKRLGFPLRLAAMLVLALALCQPLTAPVLAQDEATPEAVSGDEGETTTGDETTPPEETTVEPGPGDEGEPPVEEPTAAPTEEATEPAGEEPPPDEATVEPGPEESPVGEEPSEEPTPPDGDEPTTDDPSTEETPDASPQPNQTDGEAATDDDVAVAANGTLTINKTAADSGDPLGAACFNLYKDLDPDAGEIVLGAFVSGNCTNQQGQIVFSAVVPGDYVVFESEAPTGYVPVGPQEATVGDGADVALDLVDEVGAKGTFTIQKFDDQQNPLANSCFQVYIDVDPDAGQLARGPLVVEVCDIADQDPGFVLSRNQDPGDYILVESFAPPGYVPSTDQEFSVVSNEDTALDVGNTPEDLGGNGNLLVITVNVNTPFFGSANGACWQIHEDDNGQRGDPVGDEFCDDDFNGFEVFGDLPPGDYLLEQTRPPTNFEPLDDDVPFSIVAGELTELTLAHTPEPPRSSFEMTKEDDQGDPVADACVEVYEDLDPDPGQIVFGELIVGGTELCSNSAGFILSRNQDDGHYIAVEVVTPFGFISIDAQEFEVDGPNSPVVLVNLPADEDTPGKVIVTKRKNNSQGDLLPGACFQAFVDDNGALGDPASGEICDDDDGADDGRITIANLLEGDYLLVETAAPDGFNEADDTPIAIVRGQTLRVNIVDIEKVLVDSQFVATKVDENGDPVEGACFDFFEDLDPDPGQIDLGEQLTGALCSDQTGFILSRFQDPGNYVAFETTTPFGFITVDQEFTVNEGEITEVEIVNEAAGADTPGRIRVSKVVGNDLFGGACWKLFENDNGARGDEVGGEHCDDDEDGITEFGGILEGEYLLAETVAPTGLLLRADEPVEIVRGQRLLLELSDQLDPNAAVVRVLKIDEASRAVEGACFEFFEDLDADAGQIDLGDRLDIIGERCSDGNGLVVFRAFEPGDYVAVETAAPNGFVPVSPIEFTAVVGQQTNVNVVNLLAGSLTVIKLFCDGDEDAVEFEVSGPDPIDDADFDEETCERGDADFQISAFGETDLDPFSVGDDGEITLDDLPETESDEPHVLTELETGESVEFDIAAGEETTIVVRNISAVDDGDDDDDDDDDDDVTQLPTTGVRPGQPGGAQALLLGVVGLVVLLVGYGRRRFV